MVLLLPLPHHCGSYLGKSLCFSVVSVSSVSLPLNVSDYSFLLCEVRTY